MKSVSFFPSILWYFMLGIILIFWEKRIDSGPIFYMPKSFFGQIATKNLSLCSWEITKKSLRWKWLENFHFSTLWIWKFGIFDKRLQGCDEVKNSMGLLQGPRLMAWTTKRTIPGKHWVPLGCRALLGSVKTYQKYCNHILSICDCVFTCYLQ
jgi:hypothetical protein